MPRALKARRPPRTGARKACYDAIVDLLNHTLTGYYQRYPERIGDRRAKDALNYSIRGLNHILKILDCYEIMERIEAEEPKGKG